MTLFRVAPKLAVLIVLCAVYALSTTGCRSSSKSDEIVVGHYASLTGSEATFGQSTAAGIKMAIDEINAAGGVNGKKFRLITYDDKSDAREDAKAAHRLVTNAQRAAVMGGVGAYGGDGGQGVVEVLQTELARYMCMCGRPSLAAVNSSLVRVHAALAKVASNHG